MDELQNAGEVNSARLSTIEDGLYPVCVKDGTVYPVLLTKEQELLFKALFPAIGKITIAKDYPLGTAKRIDV